MLKISIFDTPRHRRVVIEGKLIAPWASELPRVCRQVTKGLNDRELVIDMKDLIAINDEGEKVLLELMKEGVRFRSSGVFAKHVLKRLARKIRSNLQELKDDDSPR